MDAIALITAIGAGIGAAVAGGLLVFRRGLTPPASTPAPPPPPSPRSLPSSEDYDTDPPARPSRHRISSADLSVARLEAQLEALQQDVDRLRTRVDELDEFILNTTRTLASLRARLPRRPGDTDPV